MILNEFYSSMASVTIEVHGRSRARAEKSSEVYNTLVKEYNKVVEEVKELMLIKQAVLNKVSVMMSDFDQFQTQEPI